MDGKFNKVDTDLKDFQLSNARVNLPPACTYLPDYSCCLSPLRLVWLLETLRKSKKRQNSLNSKFGSVQEYPYTNFTCIMVSFMIL